MQEPRVWSLGWEDPLEEGMATHSSILAWRIPWTEEPGGLRSIGSQRVRHDRSDLARMQCPASPPYYYSDCIAWVRRSRRLLKASSQHFCIFNEHPKAFTVLFKSAVIPWYFSFLFTWKVNIPLVHNSLSFVYFFSLGHFPEECHSLPALVLILIVFQISILNIWTPLSCLFSEVHDLCACKNVLHF